MFCTVEVHTTFEIADAAEADAILKAAHRLAVKEGTHAVEDVAEEITTPRDALQYLMMDAALELPILSPGISIYADDVTHGEANPPAPHADIIALAEMIARRTARQRDLLERAAWQSSAERREEMERQAAHLGDDLNELCARMNRLCRGDQTALDLIGPAWPDAPKAQAQACCDEAEMVGAQPRFGE